MAADERGQNLLDRTSVDSRFLGDPLQRIDAAQSHVDLLVTELLDGAGEPLGDLPLPIQLMLLLGRRKGVFKLFSGELQLLAGRRRVWSSWSRLSCSCR